VVRNSEQKASQIYVDQQWYPSGSVSFNRSPPSNTHTYTQTHTHTHILAFQEHERYSEWWNSILKRQAAKSKFRVLDDALIKNYEATKCQRLVLKCLSEPCLVCANSSKAQQDQAPAVHPDKTEFTLSVSVSTVIFFSMCAHLNWASGQRHRYLTRCLSNMTATGHTVCCHFQENAFRPKQDFSQQSSQPDWRDCHELSIATPLVSVKHVLILAIFEVLTAALWNVRECRRVKSYRRFANIAKSSFSRSAILGIIWSTKIVGNVGNYLAAERIFKVIFVFMSLVELTYHLWGLNCKYQVRIHILYNNKNISQKIRTTKICLCVDGYRVNI
jgi:hypothetical protein